MATYYYGHTYGGTITHNELSRPYKSLIECRKAALKSLTPRYRSVFIYDQYETQIGEVKDYGFVGFPEYQLVQTRGLWILNRDGTLGKKIDYDYRIKAINARSRSGGYRSWAGQIRNARTASS